LYAALYEIVYFCLSNHTILDELIDRFVGRLQGLQFTFQRSAIEWLNADHRLLGIKGSRGTGKTTLLLQYAKLQPNWQSTVLYVSLDNFWFSTQRLYHLADDFVKRGGKLLLLDEVHKYDGWAQELKNIYDDMPSLKVIFTGSSLLEILNARADLSRRAVVFDLQGLSFREYLGLKHSHDLPKVSLEDIVANHQDIAADVTKQLRPLAFFSSYLKTGYYPFFTEGEVFYQIKLESVVNLILDIELPLLRKLDVAYVTKLKQLLAVIAQSSPFIPNMTKLSERIGINRTTLLQYVHYLEEAGLIINLFKQGQGISQLQKPNKVFLDNTNLAYMLSSKTEIGALRETFFANQIGFQNKINFPEKGDFLVNETMLFEIGGKNKTAKQLKDTSNGFLALDDIEFGNNRTIPLWMFGLMY